MNDIRCFESIVRINVCHTEFLSEKHIYLDGDKRIFLAENVLYLNIKLGSVECRFVDTYSIVLSSEVLIEKLFHDSLRFIPLLCGTLILICTLRIPLRESERAIVLEAENVKAVECEIETSLKLFCKLFGTKNKVSFRDGKLTHTDKTVHLSAILISEECGGLTESHGKISVGSFLIEEHLILERARHRS